jgi:hypothetical protein
MTTMRSPTVAAVLLLSVFSAAGAAEAQGTADARLTATGRSVTATGQTKPPAPGQLSSTSQEQMLKAQRAARERDKAWDAKMNRTMGSICKGC